MQCLEATVVRQQDQRVAAQCVLQRGHAGRHVHSDTISFDDEGRVYKNGEPVEPVDLHGVPPTEWRVLKPDGSTTTVIDDTVRAAKDAVEVELGDLRGTVDGDWVRSGEDWSLDTSAGTYVIRRVGPFR